MIIIASARGKKKERKRKRLPIVQVSTPSVTLFLVHGISRPNEKDARPWEIAASGSSSFFSFFLLSSPGWKIPGESADFSRQFFTRGQLTGNREKSTDVRLSLSLSLSFLAPLEFWKEKKGNDDERGEAKSVTRCYVFTSERSRELAIDRIGPSSVHCSSTSPSPPPPGDPTLFLTVHLLPLRPRACVIWIRRPVSPLLCVNCIIFTPNTFRP